MYMKSGIFLIHPNQTRVQGVRYLLDGAKKRNGTDKNTIVKAVFIEFEAKGWVLGKFFSYQQNRQLQAELGTSLGCPRW
jgi:hypothetical protein